MDEIKRLLKNYIESTEFEDDCDTIRSNYILKTDLLPTDLEIEQMALDEKVKELTLELECAENGHDLAEEGEELDGKMWVYCKRCGEWFEQKQEEHN